MPSDPDSRLLLLMRHGKADSAQDPDRERDLTERGSTQARMIGEYLEAQGVRPTRVLVSDAERTRQTWESVLSAMPGFDGSVRYRSEIYEGGPMEVLDLVHETEDSERVVMVIGHEPTMSSLTTALSGDDSDPSSVAQARIGLPTGALCVLTGSLPHWEDLGEDDLTLHTVVRS
ncbi:phosphohistidine phosphatase [Brachybacterium endophyticum]|uniref:Phosphohistidine phosphatase n=1 Tax=Brachybacterium endophyticum TaxID=2182385 RepID=A0A2U2RIN4_9MICO|nr:histidine phosphatase family protein [Brachybacterium endophyticum]PWH05701.1 phosphohistidine phosphatase [Brachybacterium endophyticum]